MKLIYCDRCGGRLAVEQIRYSVRADPYIESMAYRPRFEDVCKTCVEEMFTRKKIDV